VIYFVQPVGGGPIKIGHSRDVPGRILALARHYDRELSTLFTMEGGYETEQAIHDRFSHLRIGITEQFRPGVDLLKFIGQDAFQSEDVEAMQPAGDPKRAITVKAYPEWKEWFDRFRAFLHARGERVGDNAALLDLSLIELAKSRGFELPPER
jgi:hypothetical protein